MVFFEYRKSYLIALFLFYVGFVHAQSYIKYIVKGKVWTTDIYNGVGAQPGGCVSGAGPTYFFSNDSLINGLTYTKLNYITPGYHYLAPNYNGSDPCSGMPGTVPIVFAYLREDTVNYKVYQIDSIRGIWKERLFLNFALVKGDSVPFHIGGTFSTPYPSQHEDTSYFLKVDTVLGTQGHGTIVFKKRSSEDTTNRWNEGIGGPIDPSGAYLQMFFEYTQTIESTVITDKFAINNGKVVVLGLPVSSTPSETFPPPNFTVLIISDLLGRVVATLYTQEDYADFCASHTNQAVLVHAMVANGSIIRKIGLSN